MNETTSATESSTRRRALQIPTLFMEGTFQLRLRPAERKGMHTLYCKGWQGPTTRESRHRRAAAVPPGGTFAIRAAHRRAGRGLSRGPWAELAVLNAIALAAAPSPLRNRRPGNLRPHKPVGESNASLSVFPAGRFRPHWSREEGFPAFASQNVSFPNVRRRSYPEIVTTACDFVPNDCMRSTWRHPSPKTAFPNSENSHFLP